MRRLLLLAVLAALTATACSGGTTGEADEALVLSDDLRAQELDSDGDAPEGNPDVPQDDVTELRTRIFGGPDGDSDLSLHLRHEEMLVDCMRVQGFEYAPLPYAGSLSSPRFDPNLDPEEFAEVYGYGLSTLYEAEEVASAVVGATYVDPNDELRAAMSPAELAAYHEALYGPPSDGLSEQESYTPADPTAGCAGEAAVVYGGVQSLDISAEARDALLAIDRVVRSDPAVRAATDDWAACMQAAGYTVGTPDDARALADSWLTPVLGTSATKSVTTTDPDGNAITVEIPAPDEAEMKAVQQREIALAKADWECDQQTGLGELFAAVEEAAQERAISEWFGDLTAAS